jgi:acetyl-CoA carboxylase carboxyl transferase subunit beta
VNWLTNYVRPRLRALVHREPSQVPENLWAQCPGCERMIFHRDLAANRYVCPLCSHHLRVSPEFRFADLFDPASWQTIDLPKVPVDPLKFRDKRRYDERLKEAQTKSGKSDAVAVAHGRIDGHPVVLAVLDFNFMGGSMGTAVGEALVAAADLARLQQASLIVVTASGGARMQEGTLSLIQMARTTAAISQVKEAGLPYLTVLADPTTGGVTASFAMLGDVAIAEPGAVIGFAGARVIEQTIRETLPAGFQRAEYLRDHGMIDMVVHRFELKATLGRVIGLLRGEPPPAPRAAELPAAAVAEPTAAGEADGA